jgi:hypothetical protein
VKKLEVRTTRTATLSRCCGESAALLVSTIRPLPPPAVNYLLLISEMRTDVDGMIFCMIPKNTIADDDHAPRAQQPGG